jgi:rhamnose utilization protein RhaD (predicted bifunctional aldolase and dehydrogenase)
MTAAELADLSRTIANPNEDCVILGEGNTSCSVGDDEFLVKASGYQLPTIASDGFVRLHRHALVETISETSLTDAEVKERLLAAVSDGTSLVPSTEAFMHALLLSIPEVEVVVHTHPTPVLALLCMEDAPKIARQRLFPDEIVCCGPRACHVPYADPGIPLARAIKESVEAFVESEGAWPKTIWLQNHGLICLGRSAAEVIAATRMQVKAARVWLAASSSGGIPTTLTPEQIARIHTRPDEHHRQKLLWALDS